MARIRTIKPEFFRHEDLFQAEQEEKLPLRIAFAGIWTVCDRDGRFKWRPNSIKLDVLPYDDVDFSRVLDALATRGFIEQYASPDGEMYGFVPSFGEHQVINNREAKSLIPSPFDACCTRDPRGLCKSKGKGKEGKGKERKEVALPQGVAAPPEGENPETALQVACKKTWEAYSSAYVSRYKIRPVRNAKVNAQVKQFVQRLGHEEAPQVAAHYLGSNLPFYAQRGHAFGNLLADAEKLRTEWATGNATSATISGKPWYITSSGIEAKAKELGLHLERDEFHPHFYDRVKKAAGVTPEMVRKANMDFGS